MQQPLNQLNVAQAESAMELVKVLLDYSILEEYTKLDYVQYARLEFMAAELGYLLGTEWETILKYYHNGFLHLQRAGFDLGIRKWAELACVRKMDKEEYED